MLFYVNNCRSGWVLTLNPFHPFLAQTEHPLNCYKEQWPVVPEPFSKVKNTDFAYETCICLQVQLCAPGKVNKTGGKTKVATQRFCLQLQERTKDVQENKDNEERQKEK